MIPLETDKLVVRIGDVQEFVPFHQDSQAVFAHRHRHTALHSAVAVYIYVVRAFLVGRQGSLVGGRGCSFDRLFVEEPLIGQVQATGFYAQGEGVAVTNVYGLRLFGDHRGFQHLDFEWM